MAVFFLSSMERTNPNYAFTVSLARAFADLGLTDVCISPGSRNTPLAWAFADHAGIVDWVHHDERSAGFFALGLAKASRTPVALVCTSGTAAAEYLPAVVEASHARVPLIVLTADRPPEVRDVGAPQAIDQRRLYGAAVRWSADAAVPGVHHDVASHAVNLASQAWLRSTDPPSGPVHLNLPFRDPLAPERLDGFEPPAPPRTPVVTSGRLRPDEDAVVRLADRLAGRRTLIVCGPLDRPSFAEVVVDFAAAADLPIVADPLSQVRAGSHDLTRVVPAAEALFQAGLVRGDLQPDVILRFGAAPTSKALAQFLAENRPEHVIIDEAGWRDHTGTVTEIVRSDPAVAAGMLAKAVEAPSPDGWTRAWVAAGSAADAIVSEALPFPSEPAAVRELTGVLPEGATLYVASSMPVRDLDLVMPPIRRRLRFLANRGANGIDGTVSSALGAATSGTPTFLLAGDVALLHDLSALTTAARLEIPLTIVLVNNDGGGIFHFLPQAAFPRHFESHLVTPHGLDFARLAGGFGIDHRVVTEVSTFRSALAAPAPAPRIIEVRTDRAENHDLHGRLLGLVRAGGSSEQV